MQYSHATNYTHFNCSQGSKSKQNQILALYEQTLDRYAPLSAGIDHSIMSQRYARALLRMKPKHGAGKSEDERRRWQRVPLSVPVFVRGADDHGNPFLEFATALDISAGGALLLMRHNPEEGSSVSLEIPCAPLPETLSQTTAKRDLQAKLVRTGGKGRQRLLAVEFSLPLTAVSPGNRKYPS